MVKFKHIMAQYIKKSALVMEIDRLKTIYNDDVNIHHIAKYNILVDILSFIDTLEVKEVENEIPTWVREVQREDPFDDRWFIGMDDCLHRKGYKIKICDLWNLPKESLNT